MANVTRAGRFTFEDATGALLVSSSGGGATSDINIKQIGGATVAMSNSLPVELSDGTNPFGTAANPLSVNTQQVNAHAVVEATSGVQKVGVVGNAGAIFDGATAATVPANAVLKGLRAATTYPTAVTDGQMVAAMGDKAGRQAVVLNAPRDLLGVQTTQIA